MVALPSPTATAGQNKASVKDFSHFHGMLCRPSTAQRCIDEFVGATILFMPLDYNNKKHQTNIQSDNKPTKHSPASSSLSHFRTWDASHILTTTSYYGLVLLSFTGLSTLLRQTRFLVGRQETPATDNSLSSENQPSKILDGKIVAESNPNLVIEESVFDYIIAQEQVNKDPAQQSTLTAKHQSAINTSTSEQFYIKRRFEYDFGGLLSVMMIHLGQTGTDSEHKTHLVEVYEIKNAVIRALWSRLVTPFGSLLQEISRRRQNRPNFNRAE